MREIDLNCDMGESFGVYQYGADKEIMPFISSANVACGFHAGDPHIMRETVEMASAYGVRVGAHVGFPDLLGFGRRKLEVNAQEVYEYVLYQLGALDAFLRAANLSMSHIKLHGALYMMAQERRDLADATVKAVLDYNAKLEVYTLPHSELALSCRASNLVNVNELFADRPYNENGVKMFGWTLEEIGSPSDISERILGQLDHPISSICVHSDTPGAPLIMKSIREKLTQSGYVIRNNKVLR